jgi:hypothetical protein
MKNVRRPFVAGILACALLALAVPALAKDKTEAEFIQDLHSSDEGEVIGALQGLEKRYPTGTQWQPAVKKLLTDSRSKVRVKAARVLGVVHAEVDETDLKNICALLKASDKAEVIGGLKSLRGLKAQSVVPQIVPLLKNSDNNIIRDSCRTLAVLGDKSLLPSIEPLLNHPDKNVQKDASDAIFALKSK